ncbi:MAG TPA: PIN domain-containing protein [Longimicrobium sp.]|uniref:PIN domain-containing protein n=1 Tax=Longimicrobium sp. TaxID=2029185 RepID=UPI002EDABB1B
MMIRLYLDTCCYSRPSDDQIQLRVRLESEAILGIVEHAARGEWTIIGSEAVQAELAAIRDPKRRLEAEALAGFAGESVTADEDRRRRARTLERMGLAGYDSVHVACAEAAGADVLLTTDDALIRRARRLQHALGVRVSNPLTWLKERPE